MQWSSEICYQKGRIDAHLKGLPVLLLDEDKTVSGGSRAEEMRIARAARFAGNWGWTLTVGFSWTAS